MTGGRRRAAVIGLLVARSAGLRGRVELRRGPFADTVCNQSA